MNIRSAFAGALILAAGLLPGMAHAGTCEETFIKKGSIITGPHYFAMISVPDLPVDIAINQMHGILAGRGYTILAEEPAGGAMLIEQPMNGKSRAVPAEVKATATNGVGTVQIEVKMRSGQNANTDAMKTELCGMLSQLKGGKAGRLAASKGATATTQQGAPLELTAQAFSQQISKDAERNMASIAQRYAGRRFTLTGKVDYIIKDGQVNRVAFKIIQPQDLALRLPGTASYFAAVSCLMAPGTSVFTLQLKPGNSVKLTGTFDEYAEFRRVVWFKECVPAK